MGYQDLYQNKRLVDVSSKIYGKLKNCDLCPRNCRVNRLEGQTGFCRSADKVRVSSAFLHFGEESELVGRGGSGTIFFSHCNLGCLYCQNYSISHLGEGSNVSPQDLSNMMLDLQKQGAENINFVTPTHFIAQIIKGLMIAADKGLKLPLVYNCGGYESLETLKITEGIFDIYMPDIKYSNNVEAEKFSQAPDYWEVVKQAAKEMYRQAGDLVIEEGVVKKGLLIRHLVLPQDAAGSFKILDFIRNEISDNTYVNIMDQYRPCYRADEFSQISRRITSDEYREVIDYAKKIGLGRGFPRH